MNLVLCVSFKGASAQSDSCTTFSFLAAEQNPVWNKTWQYTLLQKKRNYSVEKEGFLYSSLPPPSYQKQGKWKHIKYNPDRLCTMNYDTGLYSAMCKEKIAVDEAIFWSTVRDELTRIKNSFVENIHSFPNLSYPICHNNSRLLTMDILRIFKPRLAVNFIFPPCKNIINMSPELSLLLKHRRW